MNNEGIPDNYKFSGTDTDRTWFVYCTDVDETVGGKLKGRATTTGLYKINGTGDSCTSADYDGSGIVGMFIR